MSASPSPRPRSVIVTRLRAAGCVFAEDEAKLLISAARTPTDLAAMVDRRAAGLPLEYVLGWAGFCGLRIAMDPGVFIPRRRTEFLVRQAAALARETASPAHQAASPADQAASPADQAAALARPPAVVVDLCCGSGAVGAALLAALDRVDILAVNAPYVPTEEVGLLPPEARVHEPRVALDGGADGLDVVRRVIEAAPQWLAAGASLLVETSERQAPQTAETVARYGLVPRVASSDELNAFVVIGERPARPRGPG